MLIFVQVCRTIDKHLSVFKSSIGSGRTNENNGIYKKEPSIARKHLKKACLKRRGFEDHQKQSHQKLSNRS